MRLPTPLAVINSSVIVVPGVPGEKVPGEITVKSLFL